MSNVVNLNEIEQRYIKAKVQPYKVALLKAIPEFNIDYIEFYFHCHNDVPALIEEVRRLREALIEARKYLEERGIRHKGTIGRTVILPMIDKALEGK